MKQFFWGALFGIILLPALYIMRMVQKRRSERIDFTDTEWP